jgi:two-component system response regulator AlgR
MYFDFINNDVLFYLYSQAKHLNKLQLTALESTTKASETKQQLVVKTWRGTELLDLSHVHYFMADQKYVTVHHSGGETIIDNTLKELEAEYAPRFLRVHRNTLVNTDYIQAIVRTPFANHAIKLKNLNIEVSISRRHVTAVRNWLESQN